MSLTVGHTDGAHYMMAYILEAFKKAFPSVEFKIFKNPSFDPDILIFSLFGNNNQRYRNSWKVLISGEPWDTKDHEYDMLIDTKDVSTLRKDGVSFVYFPYYSLSFSERWQNTLQDLLSSKLGKLHDKFCAFLYHRNVGFRNRFFDILNNRKHVDALGKCRNNVSGEIDRTHYEVGVSSFNDKAVEKYRPYKFAICIENTIQKGYITEKIISAMLAGCIPIYLGAPDIAKHFNPKSFINIADFESFEKAADRVIQIDRDDTLYQEMLSEPWLKDNELTEYFSVENLSTELKPHLKHLIDE